MHNFDLMFQVFSPRNGQLVGYAYEGNQMASHVLVFMVCGLVRRDLRFSLGYFGTATTTASELHPLVWKAVYILEQQCGLKVCKISFLTSKSFEYVCYSLSMIFFL